MKIQHSTRAQGFTRQKRKGSLNLTSSFYLRLFPRHTFGETPRLDKRKFHQKATGGWFHLVWKNGSDCCHPSKEGIKSLWSVSTLRQPFVGNKLSVLPLSKPICDFVWRTRGDLWSDPFGGCLTKQGLSGQGKSLFFAPTFLFPYPVGIYLWVSGGMHRLSPHTWLLHSKKNSITSIEDFHEQGWIFYAFFFIFLVLWRISQKFFNGF